VHRQDTIWEQQAKWNAIGEQQLKQAEQAKLLVPINSLSNSSKKQKSMYSVKA